MAGHAVTTSASAATILQSNTSKGQLDGRRPCQAIFTVQGNAARVWATAAIEAVAREGLFRLFVQAA